MIDKHDDSHHSHPHDPIDAHSHKGGGVLFTLASALHLPGYGHTHARLGIQDALYTSNLGIKTIKLALLALGLTTLIQVIIYLASGSVALLADTVHNLGDALNSIPLLIALVIGRWTANKRYTYGYGRAEDIAGLLIVVSIAFSAGYILWESFQKLINPQPLTNLGWIAAAALIGFIGNELVAMMQINVGKQIGSEAMITDGRHARVDGLTSLAILPAVIGSWLGYPLLDPIIGILIGLAIIFITRDAIIAIWYRLMDAVDPILVENAEELIRNHPQVQDISLLRIRWIGHRLHAEGKVVVDKSLTMLEGSAIAASIVHGLQQKIPTLSEINLAIIPNENPANKSNQ